MARADHMTKAKLTLALAGVAQWTVLACKVEELLVQFPVRTHAWGSGQVLSCGCARGNQSSTSMFLSLFFSLPSPLSKNK